MKILHLTIKKQYFDLIISKQKIIEYRKITPYWITRLENKTYDIIYFRNGYSRKSPYLIAEFNYLRKIIYHNKFHYAIYLGKILEFGNLKESNSQLKLFNVL